MYAIICDLGRYWYLHIQGGSIPVTGYIIMSMLLLYGKCYVMMTVMRAAYK